MAVEKQEMYGMEELLKAEEWENWARFIVRLYGRASSPHLTVQPIREAGMYAQPEVLYHTPEGTYRISILARDYTIPWAPAGSNLWEEAKAYRAELCEAIIEAQAAWGMDAPDAKERLIELRRGQ